MRLMPSTYKTGVAFAALVEEADLLRDNSEDGTLPTPFTLWDHLTADERAVVAHFARTLLWLGESAGHHATLADIVPPACLDDCIALDIESLDDLRRYFGAQIVDVPAAPQPLAA